ncbi:MAG: hypothetical protein IR159_07610 [Brevundimonas sp.]|nr:hypothetical protein [Brevundimonas sp.]
MADTPERPGETPVFETDIVKADRAREQGLGVGERELKAQRDPGGVATPDVEPGTEDDRSAASGFLDETAGVQPVGQDTQRNPPAGSR